MMNMLLVLLQRAFPVVAYVNALEPITSGNN